MKTYAIGLLVLLSACGGSKQPAQSADDNQGASSSEAAASASSAQDMPASPDSTPASSASAAASSAPALTDTSPPAPPSPPPAVSKLKAADLKAAQKLAKPGSAYDDALSKIVAKLGQPQRTDGDYSYWYAASGKDCVEFQLQKQSDKVGAVGTQKYKKNDSVPLSSGGGTFKPNDYCGLK